MCVTWSSLSLTGCQWGLQSCRWQRKVTDGCTMVTVLWYWWQNHYIGYFFVVSVSFFYVNNRSPTSLIGHPYIKSVTNISKLSSVKTVTNIDVAVSWWDRTVEWMIPFDLIKERNQYQMILVRVMNFRGIFRDDPLILSQLLNNRYAQLGRF